MTPSYVTLRLSLSLEFKRSPPCQVLWLWECTHIKTHIHTQIYTYSADVCHSHESTNLCTRGRAHCSFSFHHPGSPFSLILLLMESLSQAVNSEQINYRGHSSGVGGEAVTGSADFCPRGHWFYSKPSQAVQLLMGRQGGVTVPRVKSDRCTTLGEKFNK